MLSNAVGSIIELALWFFFFLAIACGILITIKTKQIIHALQSGISHPDTNADGMPNNSFLRGIEDKYCLLMKNTDRVNAQAFSSGVIGNYRIFNIRADKFQLFLNQAPALLVSIGLLGTFAGLTTGLSEIQDVLQPNISPQDATLGLGKIITPMSLAFHTSLQGLTFSLMLTVIYQVTGWKHRLDYLNELLASWLETALPIKVGEKLSTPLRKAISHLDETTSALPSHIERAIENSMSASFSTKLDEFFEIYAGLSNESIRIANSLGTLASAFRESSGDYLEASLGFQNCNFTNDLERCVQGLNESKTEILHSTEKFCEKLVSIREDIAGFKSHWDVLTSLSAEQLRSAQNILEISRLKESNFDKALTSCNANSIELTKATKELRNTRLEVSKNSESIQASATAIEDRLNAASQLDNSHTNLISTYQKMVESWKLSTEQMGALYEKIIEEAKNKTKNIYDKSLATSKMYENITKENSAIADKLIKHLKRHIEDVEAHHQDFVQSLSNQSQNSLNLIERSEQANRTLENLLEQQNTDSSKWNQPWRFRK